MDFTEDLQQLEGVMDALDYGWRVQNNNMDDETRFIYHIATFFELVNCPEMMNLPEETRNYAMHRWYNTKTSEVCERIFAEYGARAATRDENIQEHIDIFINDVPFDVKISAFPRRNEVRRMHLDLRRRNDKDRLIRWLYQHGSHEQRWCENNRIFIVCRGADTRENYMLRQSYDQMEMKIRAYMEYLREIHYDFHEVQVDFGAGQTRTVKADVIMINNQSRDLKQRVENGLCPTCQGHYSMMVVRNNPIFRGNMILRCPHCGTYENV